MGMSGSLGADDNRLLFREHDSLDEDDSLDDSAQRPTLLRGCLLALVEATPGLVMVSDARGRVMYMNGMGRFMLGLTPHENIMGREVFEFYSPLACEQLLADAIPTCLRSGVWRGEIMLMDSDRNEIPVSQVVMAHHVREDGRDTTVLSSIAWDIREQKQVEQELRHQATHDALTGLPNRTLLMDRLSHAIHAAERSRTMVGVLFLDLDGFKQINDSCGHEAANLLLREIGHRLQAHLRAQDTIARYGGDEFVLLVSDLATSGDMTRVLQLVHQAVAEPFLIGGRSMQIAASVGVAMYPLDGHDAGTLLQRADTMMYERKKQLKIAS